MYQSKESSSKYFISFKKTKTNQADLVFTNSQSICSTAQIYAYINKLCNYYLQTFKSAQIYTNVSTNQKS